jgi:hypothetical protein
MNTHLAGVVFCLVLAFAIASLGPADASLAIYAVGGLENCNHSDLVQFDCVEINGRVDPCNNIAIGAANVQACKDEIVESTTICTQNNCQNVTKDKKKSDDCTTQGCSE